MLLARLNRQSVQRRDELLSVGTLFYEETGCFYWMRRGNSLTTPGEQPRKMGKPEQSRGAPRRAARSGSESCRARHIRTGAELAPGNEATWRALSDPISGRRNPSRPLGVTGWTRCLPRTDIRSRGPARCKTGRSSKPFRHAGGTSQSLAAKHAGPRTPRLCIDSTGQRAGASTYCREPCLGAPGRAAKTRRVGTRHRDRRRVPPPCVALWRRSGLTLLTTPYAHTSSRCRRGLAPMHWRLMRAPRWSGSRTRCGCHWMGAAHMISCLGRPSSANCSFARPTCSFWCACFMAALRLFVGGAQMGLQGHCPGRGLRSGRPTGPNPRRFGAVPCPVQRSLIAPSRRPHGGLP